MALKIFEKFSPRANPADSNYPYGSIKNESVPGAKDGTPLDASWGNDMGGFTDALLDEAGIVPSGVADTAIASQRLDAVKKVSSLQAAVQLIEQWGYTYKGTFANGFTYSQVGDAGVDSDFNVWIYVGAGAPNKAVTAGTVPSAPDYEQVTFNDHSVMVNRNDVGAHDDIYIRTVTLSEALPSDFKVNQQIRLSDRDNAVFKVFPVSTAANGYDSISLNSGVVLVYQHTGGEVSAKAVGAKFDYNTVTKVGTDDTGALQAAIDLANSLHLGGSFGGGGLTVKLPAGNTKYTGLTIKQGVSLIGQGASKTGLFLSGASSEGFRCDAADTGSFSQQVSRGKFEGFAMFSAEATPTAQVQWNIIGFSRWHTEDVLIEWFGGCTGITCIGAVLAGNGGPAQWYNTFIHVFLISPASRGGGGVAANLGDTDQALEQITAMIWIGGRWSAAGSGTGLSLRGTGNSFIGVTFEGLDTACDIGSTGTRGASGNNFTGCYWEGNTINRQLRANAANNSFIGSFITGGADDDSSTSTIFNEPGKYRGYLANTAIQSWEVFSANPITTRPNFQSGNTTSALDITNSAGTEVTLNNAAATSSATSFFRLLWNNFSNVLLSVGTAELTIGADGVGNIGSASNRCNTVFATNNTINTSDEREKQQIEELTPELMAVAKRIMKLNKTYKWNRSVEEKGGDARTHIGLIAQEVIAAFEAEGLDAFKYGAVCYDEWEDEYETLPAGVDDAGNVITEERTIHRVEAGNRYGLRFQQLNELRFAYINSVLEGLAI